MGTRTLAFASVGTLNYVIVFACESIGERCPQRSARGKGAVPQAPDPNSLKSGQLSTLVFERQARPVVKPALDPTTTVATTCSATFIMISCTRLKLTNKLILLKALAASIHHVVWGNC